MREYKCLHTNIFKENTFHIEPIRDEDKYAILNIRNEQLYHLRQSEPLTAEKQEQYFATVVSALFETERPGQLLFSFFQDNQFVGYGGLVHINWVDKHAEISFIMKTELEKEHFAGFWSNYLKLIEKVAFEELKFHKIFTYAFDLRPHLYPVLLESGFREEARLPEHCFFDGKYLDVLIHSKINTNVWFRKALDTDVALYYTWANDPTVRSNSYSSETIPYENHVKWFASKLKDENCFMVVFQNHDNVNIGQVRIQKTATASAIIGISTDEKHRGKGYAAKMIAQASAAFLVKNPEICISAYIKLDNPASAKAFEKAGYQLKETVDYENVASFHYIKSYENR
ncbi:GNAT family N-acetyltransferase [Flavobacterium suncheonense]|uniref:GNAT family N-acetyltransferase n=1 Tax=Flavobacterium suncheonense TaxID=350894 RepID=UPI00040653C5|nr:GNAT family N-acetyltransferase [Flavobacterium suncheonense]